MAAENLGEFLSGDRIDNSPYQLYMRDDSYCNILCQRKYTKVEVEQFKKAVAEEYHHNWIIDNLPAASVIDTEEYITTSYSRGFPVGYMDTNKQYVCVNVFVPYICPYWLTCVFIIVINK
jgi:transmembrane 9 superfamily member 2/4